MVAKPRQRKKEALGRAQEDGIRVLTAGQAFAEQLQYVRVRRGFSLSQLAERLAELGLSHLSRVVLGKIEAGGTRAENASLRDVLALAYALNVAPVLLMAPFAGRATLEVAPGVPVNYGSDIVRGWIVGRWPLTDDDPADYFDIEAPEELEARKAEARAKARDPRLSPLYRYRQLTPEEDRAAREMRETEQSFLDEERRKKEDRA